MSEKKSSKGGEASSAKRGPKGKAAQIRARLLEGQKPTEIARELSVTLPAVSAQRRNLIKKGLVEDPKKKVVGGGDVAMLPLPTDDSDLDDLARSDRAWLEWFRNNEQVPIGERLRAATALARLREEAEEETWSPPPDEDDWAEQLGEMIMAQSPAVRDKVIKYCGGSTPPSHDD